MEVRYIDTYILLVVTLLYKATLSATRESSNKVRIWFMLNILDTFCLRHYSSRMVIAIL